MLQREVHVLALHLELRPQRDLEGPARRLAGGLDHLGVDRLPRADRPKRVRGTLRGGNARKPRPPPQLPRREFRVEGDQVVEKVPGEQLVGQRRFDRDNAGFQPVGIGHQGKARHRAVADSEQDSDACPNDLPGLRVVQENLGRTRDLHVRLFGERAYRKVVVGRVGTHTVDDHAVTIFRKAAGEVAQDKPSGLRPHIVLGVGRHRPFRL